MRQLKTIITSLFLLASSLLFGKTDQHMNVLFISIDDLKPVLGCYGNKQIKTPHMDKLATTGVTFQNAYCQQAVCAASRISLFTGLRPDHTKVWDLKTYMRDMNPDVVTLPQYFKENGYETYGLGKLMHGARKNDPPSWSIPYKEDKHLIYAKGFGYPANGKYQSDEAQKAFQTAEEEKMNWKETNEFFKRQGVSPATENLDIPDNAYADGAITEAGIDFLSKAKKRKKPFFLALGYHKPHLPFVAPRKYWDIYDRNTIESAPFQGKAKNAPSFAYHSWGELRNYSDIPQVGPVSSEQQKELIHGYWASVSYIDAQIGRIMHTLKETGLDKNTLIVLWGDHGWHLGDHGLWCKHSNFEQATKVPMIFSVPNLAKGKNAYTMAEFIDIYPTLCELTGLDIPKQIDGVSLVPSIKNPSVEVKDYAISQYPRGNDIMGYTIRTKRYRFTMWLKRNFYEKTIIKDPIIEAVELYDYEKDPLEKISVANENEYAFIREKLQKKLLSLLNEQTEKTDIDLRTKTIRILGANYITRTPNGINFSRFREDILQLPASKANFNADKARTNSGIRIQFKTASPKINMIFSPRNGQNRGADFALLQNGIMKQTFSFNQKESARDMMIDFDNESKEEALFEIVLPSFANVALTQLKLTKGHALLEQDEREKQLYIALGNSITHGVGQGSATYLTYPYILAKNLNADFFNLAVGGAKISQAIAAMLKDLPKADLITTLIGYNDLHFNNKSVIDYISDYKKFLLEVRSNQPDARIYCIGLTFTRSTGNQKTGVVPDDYRNALKTLVSSMRKKGDNKLFFITGDSITSVKNLRQDFPKDKTHFSIEGAALFAEELEQIISSD